MMHILAKLLLNIFALLLVAYLVPGIEVEGFYTALIVAILLSLLNITVRPILFILTLPITILTLGLFVFILNALIFWFVASFVSGFVVSGFLSALVGTILVSTISWIGNRFLD